MMKKSNILMQVIETERYDIVRFSKVTTKSSGTGS